MSEFSKNSSDLNHSKIGRTTLFKLVIPSLLFLFFLPLIVNYSLSFFDNDDRQIYSEYKNIYRGLKKLEPLFVTLFITQTSALIFGILKLGPQLSKSIVADNKKPFTTSFKTVLQLWKWMFLSATLTVAFLGFAIYPKDSFINTFASFLVIWMVYMIIPYVIFALTHSLLIAYFIGRMIKKHGVEKLASNETYIN